MDFTLVNQAPMPHSLDFHAADIALSRAALGPSSARREIREQGTFRFAEDALPYAEANALFDSN